MADGVLDDKFLLHICLEDRGSHSDRVLPYCAAGPNMNMSDGTCKALTRLRRYRSAIDPFCHLYFVSSSIYQERLAAWLGLFLCAPDQGIATRSSEAHIYWMTASTPAGV